ncbi:MAG: V-type ATPase subunit [Oscillospiraceae bacterium]|nr:V-type ATPase subunit [Oscillospiraceae bacterium]
MLSESASYSIMSKTRAKYGHRLTIKDFNDMSMLGSVSEIASFLRTRTHYADALSRITESAIHRDNLEKILKRSNLKEAEQLCHFEKSIGENLFQFLLQRFEINELLTFMRFLAAGRPEEYIISLSYTVDSLTKLDLISLSKIRSAEELIKYLQNTRFSKITTLLPQNSNDTFDFSLIEFGLDRILYDNAFMMLDESFTGDVRKELRDIILARTELFDFMLIYRSKLFYSLDENAIRSGLLGYKRLFTAEIINEMISAKSSEDVLEIFRQSRYANKINRYPSNINPDKICKYLMYDFTVKKIHFSTNAPVVMLSYIFSKDIELENITKTIEGVRYGLKPEDIIKSLILPANKESD